MVETLLSEGIEMQVDPDDKQRMDTLLVGLHNASANGLVSLRSGNLDRFYEDFQHLMGQIQKVILNSGEKLAEILPVEQ